jgi:hypothetical protein
VIDHLKIQINVKAEIQAIDRRKIKKGTHKPVGCLRDATKGLK